MTEMILLFCNHGKHFSQGSSSRCCEVAWILLSAFPEKASVHEGQARRNPSPEHVLNSFLHRQVSQEAYFETKLWTRLSILQEYINKNKWEKRVHWWGGLSYLLSHVQLFGTLWIVAHQAPLSMGFSRQEYWSGLPFPLQRHLPDPETEPAPLVYPA